MNLRSDPPFQEMESTNRRLFALNRVAQTVNQSLNLQEVLEAALDATLKAVDVEAGNIRLWDEEQGVLRIAAHRGMSERYLTQKRYFAPGEGVTGKVFERGEPILVEDTRNYPHLTEMAQREEVRSLASIPIRSHDKMVGVMSILSHCQRRFTPPEIELLTAIGNQIGTAIENARLFEQIAQGKREWEITFDAIADGIALLDEHGLVLRANRSFGSWWDSPAESLVGAAWHVLWDRLGLQAVCPHCQIPDTKGSVATEADLPGSQRFLALTAFPVLPMDPMLWTPITRTILVIRDITERRRAEEALRRTYDELERGVQERTAELSKAIDVLQEQIAERQRVEEQLRRSEDQLRALSGHLRAVQEAERARIAREVHDELGQALTALKMDLAWVGQRLGGEQKDLQTKIQEMTHLIDETVQAVRRIATELRPGVLDHLGLIPALEWQVREFQERTGLTCVFKRSPKDLVVDSARATTVFRICQEALTNVARHAQATKVDISLKLVGRKLILEVRDNGRGISTDAVADPRSVGLMGMRERVLPWGGDIQIHGVKGKGTVVTVQLPAGSSDPDDAAGRP